MIKKTAITVVAIGALLTGAVFVWPSFNQGTVEQVRLQTPVHANNTLERAVQVGSASVPEVKNVTGANSEAGKMAMQKPSAVIDDSLWREKSYIAGTALTNDTVNTLLDRGDFSSVAAEFGRLNSTTDNGNTKKYLDKFMAQKEITTGKGVINAVGCAERLCMAAVGFSDENEIATFVSGLDDNSSNPIYAAIQLNEKLDSGYEMRLVFSVDKTLNGLQSGYRAQ